MGTWSSGLWVVLLLLTQDLFPTPFSPHREYGTIDDVDIDLHINIGFLDVSSRHPLVDGGMGCTRGFLIVSCLCRPGSWVDPQLWCSYKRLFFLLDFQGQLLLPLPLPWCFNDDLLPPLSPPVCGHVHNLVLFAGGSGNSMEGPTDRAHCPPTAVLPFPIPGWPR